MRLVKAMATVAVAFTSFDVASAQTAAEFGGEEFVRAFLGECGQSIGQIARVKAAAEAMGYMPLPPELKPLMAPQDPNADFTGYVVTREGSALYMIGLSTADLDGTTMETCVVTSPHVDPDEISAALAKFAKLSATDEDLSEMGQRYRFWYTDDLAAGSYVSLIDAGPMGQPGATLGITAPAAK